MAKAEIAAVEEGRERSMLPCSGCGSRGGSAAAIVVATVLTYLPSLVGELIWNDHEYVTRPALQSLDGLVRIWTEVGATEQYYPFLHSWFWVQHVAWGDHAMPYHVVTVLLHAGAAVLFGRVLERLAVPGAWLGAMVFALHPVHVESVAWITEQKNTLSLVFYLAAALAYLRFDATRRPRTYVAASGWFVLSLACKTVTATLPAALLVVLWWKRGRIDLRRDVRPLGVWLVVGAAAGAFSSWVEAHVLHASGDEFALSFVERGLVAGRAIWFYLGNLVWPFDLNFIYPRWNPDPAVWWQWLFPLAVLALAGASWARRRRSRAPLAVFLLFTGSLFPVLGFVNLYGARYSFVWDHWQYLPDLAPLALAAAGMTLGWRRAAGDAALLCRAAVFVVALGLGALSWRHCGVFQNDETLYRTTLARNPDCWMAHNNLALLLQKNPQRATEALAHAEAALRLKPGDAQAHLLVGRLLSEFPARRSEAMVRFREAIRLTPDNADAHVELGLELASLPEQLAAAIAEFEAALRLRPDFPEAHNALGNALVQIPGRELEAINHFEMALRLAPESAEVHNNLGHAWSLLPGRDADAIRHYEAALRKVPNHAVVHDNLGLVLVRQPVRVAEALAHFQTAVRLQPEFAEAHYHIGLVLMDRADRRVEALMHFETALRLRPGFAPAREMIREMQGGSQ